MAAKQNDNPQEQKTDETDAKLIVISGITSGIGAVQSTSCSIMYTRIHTQQQKGMLRVFTKMGHTVAGFGRRKENISALKQELNIEQDSSLLTSLDITKHEEVLQWSASIIKEYGVPSMLIHNVGARQEEQDTWDMNIDELLTSYNVHVVGSVILCKAFVPKMKELNRGTIINISSWAGQQGYAGGAAYVSSKHAIEGLTKCLAKELDEANYGCNNILACCVSPGFVNTDFFKDDSFEKTIAEQKNVATGDEWAKEVCPWLLSLDTMKDKNGKLLYHGKSIGPPIEKVDMKKYCDYLKDNFGMDMEYEKMIHEPNEVNEPK